MDQQGIGEKFRGAIEDLAAQLQTLDGLNQRWRQPTPEGGQLIAGNSKTEKANPFKTAFSNWHTRNQDGERFATIVVDPGESLL